jgi:hypothetical protein
MLIDGDEQNCVCQLLLEALVAETELGGVDEPQDHA